MLRWLFGKKTSDKAPTAAPSTTAALPAAPASAPATPPADWTQRLSEAQGDDAALLDLAGSKAPIDVRQAAVEAIASEAVLKSAELAFRDRDRRIARAARQRHTGLAAQREARSRAGELIDSARAVAGDALIPLNRLAELDRAWQALDPARLEPAQRDGFAAAMQALSSLSRERGDAQLKAERWAADARRELAALASVMADAATGARGRQALADARDAARDVLRSGEAEPAGATVTHALREALRAAELVDERLAFLEALPDPANEPAADAPHDTVTEAGAMAPAASDDAAPEQRWQAFAQIDDARLRDTLEARFAAWRQALLSARHNARSRRSEQARARERAVRQEDAATLDAALDQAEQALAEGRLDVAERHLGAVDSLASRAGIGEAQRARAASAQAGYARLKGWQHWGGGVAREELVAEAESLAGGVAEAAGPSGPPLSIKARSESIARLRARWKELDRLGGAGGGALWRRFDDALTAAYQPVAAHTAAQRAAREQNLAARQQLLDALEAVALPRTPTVVPSEPPTGAPSELPTDVPAEPTAAADATPAAPAITAPDWKSVAQALDRWLAEWRRLGPLEHTVPREQREPLLARTSAALARLEVPLSAARATAQREREQLIARARRLAEEATSDAPGRDLTGRVRELQAAWQQQAKVMPLARAAESAAWADFRGAIDAVFSARAAASSAHDAALRANAAERSELVDRLEALAGDLALADVRRELAAADAAWQRAGPPPRDAAAVLEARFRAARDAALRRIADAEQTRHRAEAGALRQKLALCEALEQGDHDVDRPTLAARWNALPALRSDWEQALARRAGLAAGKPAPASPATPELLLQLEASLGLASPPALQEARRALKLQAMKAALEGRGDTTAARLPANQLMALLLGRGGLDADQRDRLARAVDAVQATTAG